MMIAIAYVLLVLLGAKVAWNIAVPYALTRQMWGKSEEQEVGTSPMLLLEISLATLLVAFAYFVNGSAWLHDPRTTATYTFGAILISYVHFFVARMVLGTIEAQLERRKRKKSDR